MKKIVLAVAALSVFAAAPAQAATNCNAKYLEFWQKFADMGRANLNAEQAVAINRAGVRAYDACQAGDEIGSLEFWQNFADQGDSKDLEKFAAEVNKAGN